jgi:WD40 repeat protein
MGGLKIFSLEKLSQTADRPILTVPKLHTDFLSCIITDSASEYVFTGSWDKYLKVMRVKDFVAKMVQNGNNDPETLSRNTYVKKVDKHISTLAIGMDNRYLFVGCFTYFLEADEGNDGRSMVSGSAFGGNYSSVREKTQVNGIKGSVNVYKFSKTPDRDKDYEKDIHLSIETICEMENIHFDRVMTILISNKYDWVFTASNDRSIKIWELSNSNFFQCKKNENSLGLCCFGMEEYLHLSDIHYQEITGVCLDHSEKYLFTCSSDKSLNIFN